MDNENKINEDKQKIVKSFISENVAEKYQKPQIYDLSREFAKTKKNKQTFLWVMVFGFIAVIVIITLLLNFYIENKRRITSFKIPEFQEINLKDLLDTAKRLQDKLDQAKEELNALVEERNRKILNIKENISNQIQLALLKDISKSKKNEIIKRLKKQEKYEIAQVNKKYDPITKEKEALIKRLQKEMDQYDSRLNEKVKEAQKQLEKYKELSAIEMKKREEFYNKKIENLKTFYENQIKELKTYYNEYTKVMEDKYNPVFKNKDIKKILKEKVEFEIPDDFKKVDDVKILDENNIVAEDEYKLLIKNIEDIRKLADRISKIPYKNSVPIAVNKIVEKIKFIDYKYNNILANTQNVLIEKDNKISTLNTKNKKLENNLTVLNQIVNTIKNSLDFYLLKENEDGIIINNLSELNYYIYIKPGFKVAENQKAAILRDGKIIAKGKIYKSEDYYIFKLDQFINDNKIYPFDIVILLFNQ